MIVLLALSPVCLDGEPQRRLLLNAAQIVCVQSDGQQTMVSMLGTPEPVVVNEGPEYILKMIARGSTATADP